MNYNEKKETGNKYRKDYLDSLNVMIKAKQEEADKKRYDMYLKMRNNPDKYREELKKMFGWPLTDIDDNIPTCKEELVVREGTTDVIRMQFKLPIGITFYGILFKHNDKEKLPLVISQHGGAGTPELCSGLLEEGTQNYHNMSMRVFEKGVNVFAPQLLLWSEENYPIPYNRQDIDAKLKQLGSSITAVEVYAIMKSIDYLETCDFVDKEKIGMIGLSYGGFYTLCTAAIDTRIKSSLACCQYNNRYKYSWVDWTWFDAANKFFDNEIVSLVYPRYICIPVGDNDAAFAYEFAEKEYNKLKEMTDNEDWIDFVKFEGIHEFIKDDYYIEKFLNRLED